MRKFTKMLFASFMALFLVGCSSLGLRSFPQTFDIRSQPSNANIVITDLDTNKVIYDGKTPLQVPLKKYREFFEGKSYNVKISKAGYKDFVFDVRSRFDSVYGGGNFLSWGPIGWFVVDPATGAMWNLVPEKKQNMFVDEQYIEVLLEDDIELKQRQKLKDLAKDLK